MTERSDFEPKMTESDPEFIRSDTEFEDDAESDLAMQSTHSLELMDYRVMWIRNKVLTFLGIEGHELLFFNLLDANNRYYEDKLLNFLILDIHEVVDLERKVVFFYVTYNTEIIQKEVSVWESKQVNKLAALTALAMKRKDRRLIKSTFEKPETELVTKDTKIKRKRKKSKPTKLDPMDLLKQLETGVIDTTPTKSSITTGINDTEDDAEADEEYGEDEGAEDGDDEGEEEEEPKEVGSGEPSMISMKKEESKLSSDSSTFFVPPPGERHNYVLVKKMVEKVVKIPVLHMICGELDGTKTDLQNVTLFYFLRTKEEGLPPFDSYSECNDEITKYLIVGSLEGKFLLALNKMLVQVFKPLVETQFQRLEIPEILKEDFSEKEDESGVTEIFQPRSSVLKRPSEFRRTSMMISKKLASLSKTEKEEEKDEDTPELTGMHLVTVDAITKISRSRILSRSRVKMSNVSFAEVEEEEETHSIDETRNDILSYLNKLISKVEWTLERIEGDLLLTMPDMPELNDPNVTEKMLRENKEVIEKLEEVVMSWGVHIAKVLDTFHSKVPRDNGPIAEIEYWQDREIGLLMLVEQLKSPLAKKILELLNNVMSPIASNFEFFYSDLWKDYTEARDNNNFLETIQRHFKLIVESNSSKAIAQSLPTMTEGLRMIWVLSHYYSSEENMLDLLKRISWQLCQNVIKNLSIKELFIRPVEDIIKITADATTMMRSWKLCYLKSRSEIEESGKGTRWEFDQTQLFKETEYIASVCDGLNKVANVLQDFHNIFGPYLKSIIIDPAQIDHIIKRVDRLIIPILEADFNIFDDYNRDNWEAVMLGFFEEVRFLENEAKSLIDECFMVLTSAESALKVLLKFKSIKTREALHQQLLRKFDVILQQFSKEVSIVEGIYNRGKRDPPLLTYHPPKAGAIYWVRQLFYRLKMPALTLQSIPELRHNDLKLYAFSEYFEVAKQMKAYEELKFSSWADNAQVVVMNTMKKSILKVVHSDPDKGAFASHEDTGDITKNILIIQMSRKAKGKRFGSTASTQFGSIHKDVLSKPSIDTSSSIGGSVKYLPTKKSDMKTDGRGSMTSQRDQKPSMTSSMEKQGLQGTKMTWMEFMSGSILVECHLRFQVNFQWEIFDIIHEAELMEQLGFELSPLVKEASIQKNRLRRDVEMSLRIINEYNQMIETMDKADIMLFKGTLLDIEKYIQPGLTRFTWNSLNITDYTQNCRKLLKLLISVVDQVNRLKEGLDNRITTELQTYNLFTLSPDVNNSGLLPCKSYFDEIQNRRSELLIAMRKAFRSASPTLIKLENLVLGTSTGNSPAMQLFYEKYEKKIFSSFIICMSLNLICFNKSLMTKNPLFQVDAVLISSEVVLRPSPTEIYNIILHTVKNLLESLKTFPRWMNGTCLEFNPHNKNKSEKFPSVTYFEDVMSIQVINDNILIIQESAHRLSLECWHYLTKWKKYSNLWTFDKNLAAKKFTATDPTLVQYNDKFTFYENILDDVKEMETYHDLYSIRLNLLPLLSGMEHHAKEWKQVLGNFLLEKTLEEMNELKVIIENFRSEVEIVITGLDRFTSVMQAISDIKKNAVQAEVRITTYQETFETFRRHNIMFPEENEQSAIELQRDWESLYLGALYRASTLETTCDRFSEMTMQQIDSFLEDLMKFALDFEENGPGSVGEDLELGLIKMDEYGARIAQLEEIRQSMTNSELLFDLPATDYSVFLKVMKDYEGMELLYNLYKQQQSARDEWAQTLWVNLNPQLLIEGMDHFIREYRKLPKFVRELSVGQALDTNMKSFKNSVPLFIELKNEAMRERHWKELMKKTGQYFDMNPDRCDDDRD